MSYSCKEILEFAKAYRRTIEAVSDDVRASWSVLWNDFPLVGSCDVAHQTLACLLKDQFDVDPEQVAGFDLNEESHVWLEFDGFILDVAGTNEPVTLTRDRKFLSKWSRQCHRGIVDRNDGWWGLHCHSAYDFLSQRLSPSH